MLSNYHVGSMKVALYEDSFINKFSNGIAVPVFKSEKSQIQYNNIKSFVTGVWSARAPNLRCWQLLGEGEMVMWV